MLQVLDAILSNPDDNTQVCHPVVSFKPGVTLCFDGTVITVPTDHLEFVPCTVQKIEGSLAKFIGIAS